MTDLSNFDPNGAGNPNNNIFGLPFAEEDARLVLLPINRCIQLPMSEPRFKLQLLNRVGYVEIPALIAKVASDIEMARNWKSGTIKPSEVKRNSGDNPFKP